MPNTRATVARLREVLASYFERELVDTVLRRMREAGAIPAGKPGRNGAGSATIEVRQAALVMIALASGVDPIAAPAAAERIGDFRLRAVDRTHLSDPNRRREHVDGLSSITFLNVLVGELGLMRGGMPDHEPTSWRIERNEVAQAAADRLVFGGLPTEEAVRRITIIPARLIRDVAAIFPECETIPQDTEQQQLAAWVTDAFGRATAVRQGRNPAASNRVCTEAGNGN